MKCGTYSSLGSRCVQDAGHEGPHQAVHGWQWTDESDARSAEEISRRMGGKTE
jgi:hypothetical protein